MNPLNRHDKRRKLLVLLAAAVLFQTLLGIPEPGAGGTRRHGVIGGIASSTPLTLLILPILYQWQIEATGEKTAG